MLGVARVISGGFIICEGEFIVVTGAFSVKVMLGFCREIAGLGDFVPEPEILLPTKDNGVSLSWDWEFNVLLLFVKLLLGYIAVLFIALCSLSVNNNWIYYILGYSVYIR